MNDKTFQSHVHQYKDTIYRIALNYLGNPYDADDIVQDALMKLYLSRKHFESREHVRYWLIRVTINLCKNTLRLPWRKQQVALEEYAAGSFEHQEQSELFLTVMSLPEKHRVVLYLFYYEDFSVREIAEMLNIKESAVTTRLSRARQRLKLDLTEGFEYG